MSLLYKMKNTLQLSTKIQRPSPKRMHDAAGFAQSLSDLSQTKSCIEGISLQIFRIRSLFRHACGAGMTVEAAMVLPLFLFFFLHLCSVMEMLRLHGNLELALRETGNQLAVYAHVLTKEEAGEVPAGENADDIDWQERLSGVALSYGYVRGRVIDYVGADYLEQAPLRGGAGGLQFAESSLQDGDYLEVVMTYEIAASGSLLPMRSFRMANRYYGHLWNGYQLPAEGDGSRQETDTVYVTQYGTVYHERRTCTYISLSVYTMSLEGAREARNQYGASYTPCLSCGGGVPGDVVYLTKTGDRYHYDAECSHLKRLVTAISHSQAREKGYTPCRRCCVGNL